MANIWSLVLLATSLAIPALGTQTSTGAFRPPAIPLITTDPYMQMWLMGDSATSDLVRHWDTRPREMVGLFRVDGEAFRFLGDCAGRLCEVPAAKQIRLDVQPTRTVFVLRDPSDRVELTLTFLSTMFTSDYDRLSRPISYVLHEVRSLDNKTRDVPLYFDMTAQHVVNSTSEAVTWQGGVMGTRDQQVLGTSGDFININWGFLYLRDAQPGGQFRSGSAKDQRRSFMQSGSLPTTQDTRMPRRCDDDMPALSLVRVLRGVARASQRHTVLVGYDDVKSVSYYNEGEFAAYWTRTWPTLEDAMAASAKEVDKMLETSISHDAELVSKLVRVGGDDYAKIGSLAYRQTLAATKLVWNSRRQSMWVFLKEISTNGDMQTMDVVYPASPMLLYSNPELLKLLLIPVLAFANNETSTSFTNAFSPHELGRYPIANHTTAQQEPMPMENTGNMFLMLAGIARTGTDMGWLAPYMNMLRSWADFLQRSLPFPANQKCTDDFEGKLANNTNLAAKGIVALEAFADVCDSAGVADCQSYRAAARIFATTWQQEAWEGDHYRIAFHMRDTYSIKYNLVWQKLLRMDGPFDWQKVGPPEVKYYVSKANKYGTPMDYRHNYTKLDWLSWAAVMADDDAGFHALQDPVYKQAQETGCRLPLTDLFDTVNATCASFELKKRQLHFIARPVVGGVFAKMLAASDDWLSRASTKPAVAQYA